MSKTLRGARTGVGGVGGKRDKKGIVAEAQRVLDMPSPTLSPPTLDECMTLSRGYLCKGLFRTYVALSTVGLGVKPVNLYTTWEWRFTQRFRAFHCLSSPPPVTYEAFREVLQGASADNSEAVLGAAAQCFKAAKATLDDVRTQGMAATHVDRLATSSLLSLLKVVSLYPHSFLPCTAPHIPSFPLFLPTPSLLPLVLTRLVTSHYILS